MRGLLFLSRVAFICNIFFLLAFSLQLSNWIKNEELTSTILMLGYVFVFILSPIVNICYLFLVLLRRKLTRIIPAWLVTANALFLVIELFYILYINK
jgi:hypothetical protein